MSLFALSDASSLRFQRFQDFGDNDESLSSASFKLRDTYMKDSLSLAPAEPASTSVDFEELV